MVVLIFFYFKRPVNPLVSYILTIVHWAECCRVFKVFFSSRFNFRIQYSTEWVHICSGTGCRNPCFYTWTGHVSISGRWRIYYFSRIRFFCCIETGEQCFIFKKMYLFRKMSNIYSYYTTKHQNDCLFDIKFTNRKQEHDPFL